MHLKTTVSRVSRDYRREDSEMGKTLDRDTEKEFDGSLVKTKIGVLSFLFMCRDRPR